MSRFFSFSQNFVVLLVSALKKKTEKIWKLKVQKIIVFQQLSSNGLAIFRLFRHSLSLTPVLLSCSRPTGNERVSRFRHSPNIQGPRAWTKPLGALRNARPPFQIKRYREEGREKKKVEMEKILPPLPSRTSTECSDWFIFFHPSGDSVYISPHLHPTQSGAAWSRFYPTSFLEGFLCVTLSIPPRGVHHGHSWRKN